MKKYIFASIIIASVTTFISCTPKLAKVTATTPALPESASTFSSQELAEGKVLMEANCARCHKLKAPENYTAASWDKILKRMFPKAKSTVAENEKIQAYILSLAKSA